MMNGKTCVGNYILVLAGSIYTVVENTIVKEGKKYSENNFSHQWQRYTSSVSLYDQ